MTRFEVSFLQEQAHIASLGLAVKVLKRVAAQPDTVCAGVARKPAATDDRLLSIAVIDPSALEPNRFRYQVTSRALGWTAREFVSPVLNSGLLGFQQFVIRRYAELEDAFAPTVVDLEHARDRLEGFGLELGKMLFPEELVEELWDHRESIGPIHLRSFGPYVPWELVRLWNPSSRSKTPDDRFLGQYDLVRHFSGDSAPQALGRADWTVVIGDYQNQPGYEPVGEEKPFFTDALPMELPKPPELVPAHKTKVKALLKAGRSDVIHLACHGEADLADIRSSNLIIGVRPRVGGFDPVKLATNDVRSSLRLIERRPIVFLNACQTGRIGITIGQESGWPRVLWDAGAGVVVGTLWKVRSHAAKLFAIAFYESLMAGEPLGRAAGIAREAARANGDVSWMAYVVYGDPLARMV